MAQFTVYMDEDAMDSDLVAALRSRGVIVITALDAGLIGIPDEEQLAFATAQECVLYTFNVSDFHRLHTQWMSAGREHAGMILSPQQRFSVGEQLRCILRLRAATATASMRNQVEFLRPGSSDAGEIGLRSGSSTGIRVPESSAYPAITLVNPLQVHPAHSAVS